MVEENKTGKAPDFKGDGVAAWWNKDKNDKKYLSVVVLGSIRFNLFENDFKQDNKSKVIQLKEQYESGMLNKEQYYAEIEKIL